MTLAEIVAELTVGWREHIEYMVKVGDRFERRSDHRMQPSLIQQLKDAHYSKPVTGGDSVGGSAGTKVHADIPGNLEGPDEILSELYSAVSDVCCAYNWTYRIIVPTATARDAETVRVLRHLGDVQQLLDADHHRLAVDALMRPYRRARVLLGYDDQWVLIAGTVCGDCDGQLRVERQQPKIVRCCACPRQYHYTEWIRMASA